MSPPLPASRGAGASVLAQARTYRRDIDGLRAIAILVVVLSHMRLAAAGGGFVGVDIFFVISGFLLTGNIAQSLADGKFSVAGFYERRIRRIFPALAAMAAATSVLVYLVFPPQALILYGQSLFAAIFSYSNFYFFTQSGYFSLTSTKMLLHTWSLGVEEQFYLVLPLCMLFAAKGPSKATRWVVGVLGAISFALAAHLTLVDRSLAFYMPYTRAWELLLGSALALKMVPSPSARWLRESLACISLLVILVCVYTYTSSTPFPGLTALPPCAAAAMLILIGERGSTSVSSFLTWRPFVFIGAISYSLYLWHWPVIMFFNLGIVPKMDFAHVPGLSVAKIVLSFALGTLSWRYIEQPFRTGRWKSAARTRVFQTAGAVALALSAVAATFIAGRGLPDRFPPAANIVGNYLIDRSATNGPQCFVETDFADFDSRRCLAQVPGRTNVLLLGDSHAKALWLGLARGMPHANVMYATGSSCPPIKGNYDRSTCGSLRRFIYSDYLPSHHVDMVILTEAWNSDADLQALAPALRWFATRKIPVFVIGPVPEYTASLPLLLALGLKWHIPALAEHRLLYNEGALDRALSTVLQRQPGVHYASVWRALCPADRCQEYADRDKYIPMLFDDNHVTDEGAALAVRRMQAAGQLPH